MTGGGGPWLGRQVFEWSGPAGLGPQAAGDFGLPVHLQALNANLLAAVSGRNGRFVIAMPPRHGKSFLVSHLLPVWYLRKFPRRRVMLCSYGGRFAGGWGRRARDLFEGTAATTSPASASRSAGGVRRDARSQQEWEVPSGGGMVSVGVGGALTGRGAHLLIVDDPIKNAAEARSDLRRAALWDWFSSTAMTRLEPGGSALVVQTRWHEADLAGRLQTEEEVESWQSLLLPAVAELRDALGRDERRPLWPERYSEIDLARLRARQGGYWWSALYQQRPTPECGGFLKREWFRHYEREGDVCRVGPNATDIGRCTRFATIDLAIGDSQDADYTVAAVFAASSKGCLFLLDLVRDRPPPLQVRRLATSLAEKWRLDWIGVEKTGFQEAIIADLKRTGLAIRGLKPGGDKRSRAGQIAVRLEAGQLFFPTSAPWLADLEAELLQFPNGRHDDQVDALGYGCREAARFLGEN